MIAPPGVIAPRIPRESRRADTLILADPRREAIPHPASAWPATADHRPPRDRDPSRPLRRSHIDGPGPEVFEESAEPFLYRRRRRRRTHFIGRCENPTRSPGRGLPFRRQGRSSAEKEYADVNSLTACGERVDDGPGDGAGVLVRARSLGLRQGRGRRRAWRRRAWRRRAWRRPSFLGPLFRRLPPRRIPLRRSSLRLFPRLLARILRGLRVRLLSGLWIRVLRYGLLVSVLQLRLYLSHV